MTRGSHETSAATPVAGAGALWPSIPSLTGQVRSGMRDTVSVVEQALERCSQAAMVTGALECVLTDRARQRAASLDAGTASLVSDRLLGLPFVAKGNMRVRGQGGFGGSYLTAPADRDAAIIEVLESHGAVLVGVCRYTELALASSEAEIDGHAVPNPNDERRSVGGSSSGSAAAVRASVVPVALGTDTGGSVRIPAAFAGVAGYKPSDGLLPRTGVMPVSWTLDQVGFLARTSADVTAVLAAMFDGYGEPPPSGTVVGLVTDAWEQHPRTEKAAGALVDRVRDLLSEVFELREVPFPAFAGCGPILSELVSYEAARSHGPAFEHLPELFGRSVRARLKAGAAMTEDDHRRLLDARDELRARVREVFERVDLLVLPTIPFVPPLKSDVLRLGSSDHARLTRLANLAGLPATSVPGAWVDGHLPLGIQVVGSFGADAAVLGLARLLEQPEAPNDRGADDRDN